MEKVVLAFAIAAYSNALIVFGMWLYKTVREKKF